MLKVLIVEDSPDIQCRLQEMLLVLGNVIIVGCAEDVAQGIALADAVRPDVALLDISLRGGRSSLPLLRHLRQVHPGTRVAMLSNFGWGVMRDSCLSEGAVAFFDKALEFRAARDWVAAQAAQLR